MDDAGGTSHAASVDEEDEHGVLTVAELNSRIAETIDAADSLSDVRCIGEVSDCHTTDVAIYFTLASDGASINCVCWQNRYQDLDVDLEAGLEVVLEGSVDLYVDEGRINVKPWEITPVGEGDRHAERERLRKDLAARGWFDEERKQSLPQYPTCVGVVTSRDGDARYDITDSIHERYPDVDIVLHHASVQGEQAPDDLATGIARLDQMATVDVIVVGRGGGSDENLRAFDTETVAEAIHATQTPVVAAVGHQSDRTIAGEVADAVAITPTAAGATVVREKASAREDLADLASRVDEAYHSTVTEMLDTLSDSVDAAYQGRVETDLDRLEADLESAYADLEHEHEKRQAIEQAQAESRARERLYKAAVIALALLVAALLLWMVITP